MKLHVQGTTFHWNLGMDATTYSTKPDCDSTALCARRCHLRLECPERSFPAMRVVAHTPAVCKSSGEIGSETAKTGIQPAKSGQILLESIHSGRTV